MAILFHASLADLCALALACISVEGEVLFLCCKGILHSLSREPTSCLHTRRCLVLTGTEESYDLVGGPDVLGPRMSRRVDTVCISALRPGTVIVGLSSIFQHKRSGAVWIHTREVFSVLMMGNVQTRDAKQAECL